ncbi:MAG: binding-protein-dependent transport system inner rane component, partial [Polaromonas sp.]|nr:binding-protein-dependent transport system inner rane component [Polaromonas sp.]
MTTQTRELQVTPMPDVIDEPGLGLGLGLISFAGGLGLARLLLSAVLRDLGHRLLPWLVPVGLIALWQVATSLGWLSTRVLPAPSDVIKAAWTLAESGELWTHVKVSAGRALSGLAIGGGLGLALGLLTGSVRIFETLLDSTIQMVRNIPALALIPLVILWFGIDETA